MTTFCPLSSQPVFYNGVAQVGARITVYDAGTLTPRTAFSDGLAQHALAQPIPSDGNGCIPLFWVVGNPYRVRVVSPGGVLIRDVDNLPGDVAQGGGGGGGGGSTLKTGDYVPAHTTAVITGRVRANGKTIGDAISGATEFADPATQALFIFLWNADSSLSVSGGRGASALADYNANKTIALPDINGRTLFGIDGMGSSPTGRLANATFASGNATTIGSAGGTGAETLLTTQIPSHTHTGATQNSTAHSHTFTTASAGSHNHGGATGVESAGHTHSGTTGIESVSHTHSGSTDLQGAHSHPGSVTDTQGNHQHTYNGPPSNTIALGGNGSVNAYWFGASVAATDSVTGAHAHNLAINSDGTHNHNVSVGTESANHTHSITTGTESANQTHAISTDGAHTHTGVTDAGGVHNHSFTSDATGGGGTHNNMPPFLLVTWYLVL
ncbi:hypothetical protein SAMN05519104_1675 [Rhizobiales bacterium GAS188]|nr:hypothetical protein SAMN05519104_1675 [Rhizobiales bacterium GAS188]